VEILLRQAAQFGLHTRVACVEYLGNLFRVAMDAPARKTDYQVGTWVGAWVGWKDCTEWVGGQVVVVDAGGHLYHYLPLTIVPCWLAIFLLQIGEQLLRDLLFIHIDQPADKLQLTCQMLLKLFALVSRVG
jgi:hypothetical protein